MIVVTAWYLYETIKQRRNSEKQLELLRKQHELQNRIKVIPDVITSDFSDSNKRMSLETEVPQCKAILHNFSEYEIYNVWLFYGGIYDEGSFLGQSRQYYEFIEKGKKAEFPIEIEFHSLKTTPSYPTKDEEFIFKNQLEGFIRSHIKDLVTSDVSENAISKILSSWDSERKDITAKSVIIVIFYDRLDNVYLTTRVYRLGYNPKGKTGRTLTWIYNLAPKTEVIYDPKNRGYL